MRITTKMISSTYLRNLNGLATDLNKYNNQVASGREFMKAAEDPASAVRAYRIRENLSRIEGYQSNVTYASGYLTNAESVLDGVQETLIEAKQKILQAINGTQSVEERTIIATELRTIQDELLQSLNSNDFGIYIFGGSNTDEKPFTTNAAGELVYNGYDASDLVGAAVNQIDWASINNADPTQSDYVGELTAPDATDTALYPGGETDAAYIADKAAYDDAVVARDAARVAVTGTLSKSLTNVNKLDIDWAGLNFTDATNTATYVGEITAVPEAPAPTLEDPDVTDTTLYPAGAADPAYIADKAAYDAQNDAYTAYTDYLSAVDARDTARRDAMGQVGKDLQNYLESDSLYLDIGLDVEFADDNSVVRSSVFSYSLTGLSVMKAGSTNITIDDGLNAFDVSVSNNLYDMLGQIATELEKPDGEYDYDVADAIYGVFNNSTATIVNNMTLIGTKGSYLNFTSDRLSTLTLNLQERQVDVEGVDSYKAIINFKTTQASQQAALQMGNYIIQSSIFDYMS